MLKLGQGVCPVRGPRIGSDDYDDDGIDTGTWISGIVLFEGEIYYQLYCYPVSCLWSEEDLRLIDYCHQRTQPMFSIGDDVRTTDEPDRVHTITHIYQSLMGYRYIFKEQGTQAYINKTGILESEVQLHRKRTDICEYSLF